MLESAIVVKVAKDHVVAAARFMQGEGWILRVAEEGPDGLPTEDVK